MINDAVQDIISLLEVVAGFLAFLFIVFCVLVVASLCARKY